MENLTLFAAAAARHSQCVRRWRCGRAQTSVVRQKRGTDEWQLILVEGTAADPMDLGHTERHRQQQELHLVQFCRHRKVG